MKKIFIYNMVIHRIYIKYISNLRMVLNMIIHDKALFCAIIFIVFKQVILSEVHLDISILIENSFYNMS